MKVASITPVLFVDRVEPTRDFFLKAGFTVMFDVPEGDRLGFVGLTRDGAQVMVETYDRQVQIGWLYRDAAAGAYRPTWKGAFLMTWGQLWPMKAIREAGLRARERRILTAFRSRG